VSINCGSKAVKYKSALGLDISIMNPLKNTRDEWLVAFLLGCIVNALVALNMAPNPKYKR